MGFLNDWRAGMRMFVRQPGLTSAAVVALALGVGLTTLLFSIGYGIFLRGLPVPEGRRIMAVTFANVATGRAKVAVGIHDVADWRAAQRSFHDLAAFETASINVVAGEGQPERLQGALLTDNGFAVLQAQPLMGRTLQPGDGVPGAAPVLVLGYDVWTTRFGGDPHVIGRTVRANGELATIVGVMPPRFGFPMSQDAWMALRADPLAIPRGRGPSLIAYGRLRPGVSAAQAQADLGTIAARLAREHPDTNRQLTPTVRLYTEAMGGGEDGRAFMILTIGLGFGVLLVGCANVANLLFARAASRTREIAIRTALGAGRGRIIGQLLIETTLLAVGGSLVGLLLASAGIALFNRAIVDLSPPFWIRVQIDAAALVFAVGLTALSAVLAGATPAWRTSRADVNEIMKDGARSGGLRIGRASRVLVTSEVVLSFALLVAAGLMIRSILNLGTHEYGFATDNVFTARIVLPEGSYADAGRRSRFEAALRDRMAALPGVQAATITSALPGLSADRTTVTVDGQDYGDDSHYPIVRTAAIAPHFFETFDRQLLRGREFMAADDDAAPRVAVVNASFAAQFFAGADPVGRRIRLGRDPVAPPVTVVGLAPDLYMSGAENRDPAGVYVPLAQSGQRGLAIAARVSEAPLSLAPAVRALVRSLDRDLPVFLPDSLRLAIDNSLWAYRVFGPLLVVVGAAALFLAAVGLYGLMAFAVGQRTREIGLRMALGARPPDIASLIARRVTTEMGIGLLAGGALAVGLARLMRAMLFHVQPEDPLTFGAIVLVLIVAAAVAAIVPVRRAIRVDPTVALRAD